MTDVQASKLIDLLEKIHGDFVDLIALLTLTLCIFLAIRLYKVTICRWLNHM